MLSFSMGNCSSSKIPKVPLLLLKNFFLGNPELPWIQILHGFLLEQKFSRNHLPQHMSYSVLMFLRLFQLMFFNHAAAHRYVTLHFLVDPCQMDQIRMVPALELWKDTSRDLLLLLSQLHVFSFILRMVRN